MEKISPLPNRSTEEVRYYDPKTQSGRLETAILAAGKGSGVGDIKKLWASRGPGDAERAPGIDMTIEQRAYRTLDVRKFTTADLEQIHRHEKQLGFFLMLAEMKKITKSFNVPDQFHLKPDQVDDIKRFNNSRRPIMTRGFSGMRIPPYFVYDLEFDGMEYHHAWDRSVQAASWAEPTEIRSGRAERTSRKFA